MKNKLCAEIRSDFYTIWVLTDEISSKNRLCAEIRSYILYLLLATHYCTFGFRYTNKSTFLALTY